MQYDERPAIIKVLGFFLQLPKGTISVMKKISKILFVLHNVAGTICIFSTNF